MAVKNSSPATHNMIRMYFFDFDNNLNSPVHSRRNDEPYKKTNNVYKGVVKPAAFGFDYMQAKCKSQNQMV